VPESRSPASPYELAASEYYDPLRHPTCAAFRAASILLLKPVLADPPSGLILEVGAGCSLVYEVAPQFANRTIVSDVEPTMLTYSARLATVRRRLLVVMSATRLAVKNGGVELIVASLGDPYNVEPFWRECARTLTSGGRVAFTTPSFSWSEGFRPDTEADVAEFELADGREVALPSFILSRAEQQELIRSAGLEVGHVEDALWEQVPVAANAPKLSDTHGPVATLHVARKP